MATRKLSTPILSIDQWPVELRTAFEHALARMQWPASFAQDIRRALENVLGFQAARAPASRLRLPTPAQARRYIETLRATLAPASVTTYVQHLYYALALVAPEVDWRWLYALYQELRIRQMAGAPGPAPAEEKVCRRAAPLALPIQDWPAALRAAWHAARRTDRTGRYRNLEAIHPASQWSSAYAKRVARGFGLFLGFLQRQHHALALTPETLEAFVGEAEERGVAPVSLASYVEEIHIAAQALLPGDWGWLAAATHRIRTLATPSRRIVTRIVPSQELFAFGLQLMREAERSVLSSASALLYRDGLMIALLAKRPIRLRNLAEMRIGTHLVLSETGGYLFFPATKNGAPYDAPVPSELVPHFHRWIAVYRRFLIGDTDMDACWVGRDGAIVTANALSRRIGDVTLARLRRRVSPHLFRHAFATTIAEHDRRKLRAAVALLGQRDENTIRRHYEHATSIAAARGLAAQLARFRKRPPARRRAAGPGAGPSQDGVQS